MHVLIVPPCRALLGT